MTTLLVLGFPYPTTAGAAAQEVLLQERDLAEPDAVAVVIRDDQGAFHITTNHTPGTKGYPRFFWQLLLTALILPPGSGDPADEDLEEFFPRPEALGLDDSFQDQVREMLPPDTSALFLLATEPVPADALTALGRFGGKLLAASLVPGAQSALTSPGTGARRGPRSLPLPRQE
jgi:uncharacterized membrane protein